MNAITRLGRRGTEKYTPSSVRPEDAEASQRAARGYGFSRIRNAERIASLGVTYGTLGLLFGGVWMGMWFKYPQERQLHHWMIWDGVHAPFELPGMKIALEQAPADLNLYFAWQYVLYRERYYYDLFLEDRLHVAYQTGREEAKEYDALVDPKNPDAPVTDLAKNGFIEIKWTGSDIELIKDSNPPRYHSKVFYTRRYQKYGAVRAPAVQMFAEFTWEKHPENVPENLRTYSPIGMVVIHYNRQKENPSQ